MHVNNWRIGARLGMLAAILLLTTIFVGLRGWITLASSYDQNSHVMQQAETIQRAIDAARSAQVQFKIQVQEWKDTLLRGSDPEAFAKYRQAFVDQGKLTQSNLEQLNTILPALNMSNDKVKETQRQLAALEQKYLQVLQQEFRPDDHDSVARVDRAVKIIVALA